MELLKDLDKYVQQDIMNYYNADIQYDKRIYSLKKSFWKSNIYSYLTIDKKIICICDLILDEIIKHDKYLFCDNIKPCFISRNYKSYAYCYKINNNDITFCSLHILK